MMVLSLPVFLGLAVASFLTDNPIDQKVIGAWFFLSLGVLFVGGSQFAIRTFLHRTAIEPRKRNVLPPRARALLGGWGVSWLVISAYVAVTGNGVSGGRWLIAALAAAAGAALVLLAVRQRASAGQ